MEECLGRPERFISRFSRRLRLLRQTGPREGPGRPMGGRRIQRSDDK